MLSDVVQHISGAHVPGIVGTVLMMIGFVGVVIWAIRLDKRHIAHMSHLPLDLHEPGDDDRGVHNG